MANEKVGYFFWPVHSGSEVKNNAGPRSYRSQVPVVLQRWQEKPKPNEFEAVAQKGRSLFGWVGAPKMGFGLPFGFLLLVKQKGVVPKKDRPKFTHSPSPSSHGFPSCLAIW